MGEADVSVWCADVDACMQAIDFSHYEALMSPMERLRNQRFIFERDRRTDLVARALVRTVLGRWLGTRPEAIRFDAGPRGKPRLALDSYAKDRPHFNLTHSQGKVILALSKDRPIGVDVEYTNRTAPLDLVSHYFMDSELQALRGLPTELQAGRFWDLWTLKESLVKACGEGLYVPLDSFGFNFNGGDLLSLNVSSFSGNSKVVKPWWFGQWCVSTRYVAALCVDSSMGPPASVRFYETVPLLYAQSLSVVLKRISHSGHPIIATDVS